MALVQHLWGMASYLVPFLFVLTIVVFFHELGHFLVGRWCGVKADAFSIGFGREIVAFTDKKGTRWRFAWIPLGGYVKFHGDPNAASMGASEIQANMSPEERKISFFAQPVWKRAAIVFAGPAASFLLGLVIFTGSFWIQGRGDYVPQINRVQPGQAAEAAGFQSGDVVVSINGNPIENWGEMQRIVQISPDVPLTFVVQRANKDVNLTVTPRLRELVTPFGKNRVGSIGVEALVTPENWRIQSFSLPQAAVLSVHETSFIIERTVSFIGGVFVGRESTDQISGPIRIAEISGVVAKVSFGALLNLAAILSISIGLLNLLPVPMLDGGHLLYYAIEAVKGRPMSERKQEWGFRVGLGLVMALMLFATMNDLLHVGPKLANWLGAGGG
ncbi:MULTISPECIES: RIP metalloprotease RseP [unclassified Beijerinckia]|uniref:RIP metalloprotease RseP n=1 Tax=unclassified Beijerinckia TaxID=2638183 RepID=UPI0008968E09|nr:MULTISPECIES: RIP metalloprotease RseP [unclassified Beijerinckia]MDH7795892.1 regulator of sigma E protease [Beijerinckia sp. GAS462]SEC20970.1 site-2 protease. Metallo peptidase. MEROPS family M50B [Beijerinckia sp. 28-YEA-48]